MILIGGVRALVLNYGANVGKSGVNSYDVVSHKGTCLDR